MTFLRPRHPLLLGIGLTVACVNLGPATDPSRYFHLPAPEAPPASAPVPMSIGIGKGTLPGDLGGSHLVRRLGPAEIFRSSSDYWAEPLADQVQAGLKQGLEEQLGLASVATYPWRADRAPDLQLDVQVYRFDADTLGRAELEANWSVTQVTTRKVMAKRHGTWHMEAPTGQAEDVVVAMGAVLQQMIGEVAVALRQMRP
jgi:uncharacterized lipoprotein YmbA